MAKTGLVAEPKAPRTGAGDVLCTKSLGWYCCGQIDGATGVAVELFEKHDIGKPQTRGWIKTFCKGLLDDSKVVGMLVGWDGPPTKEWT